MKKIFFFLLLVFSFFNLSFSENLEEVKEDKNETIQNSEENSEKKEQIIEEEIKDKVEEEEIKIVSLYEILEDYTVDNFSYTLDLKFDKYFNKDLNHFVYFNFKGSIRKEPSPNSKIIKTLNAKSKIQTTALIKGLDGKKWYEVIYKGEKAYVRANNVIKRGFNWQRAIEKAEKLNQFIKNTLDNNKKLYYVDAYVSLLTTTNGKKDRYGNAANQSIKAYYNNNKDYINLPDRALFIIVGETDKYIQVKTMSYGEEIYNISKSDRKKLKVSNISELVNKFIYVDRNSQTQVSIEKNKETGIYNVNTVGYVTTGITKGTGFVTPFGDYLVAYTKPIMAYTADDSTEIVGDAKYAIRFSGGGYLHGIPSKYGDNREARKKATASKLGTIPLSHKCVRNEDDVIAYMYKWINGKNKIQKNGFTYPEENVILIVE